MPNRGLTSDDSPVMRCGCHGAWCWHGVCSVTADRRMREIVRAVARTIERDQRRATHAAKPPTGAQSDEPPYPGPRTHGTPI